MAKQQVITKTLVMHALSVILTLSALQPLHAFGPAQGDSVHIDLLKASRSSHRALQARSAETLRAHLR